MRRTLSSSSFLLVLALSGVLPLLLAGCGDPNSGALFAEIVYATRCEETLGCGGPQDRDICGIDNGDMCEGLPARAALFCDIAETPSGDRTLNFSASQGGGFSIAVSQALFAPTGGSARGAGCRVTVSDGSNTYEGTCGDAAPCALTPNDPDDRCAQPCQINNVVFTNDDGNPTINGAIYCHQLANRANPNLSIEVTNVGTGPEPRMLPGRFRITNCNGLDL